MATATETTAPVVGYLQRCAAEMLALAANPIEVEGAQRFIEVLDGAAPTAAMPATPYPALDSLDGISDTDLAVGFAQVRDAFPWKPSGRMTDNGIETVICELNDFLDMGDLWAGITVIAPHCGYPRHDHPPQELYLIVSGQALWRYGGSQHEVSVPAGALIYNNPGDVHSMRCLDEPLLALWFLW